MPYIQTVSIGTKRMSGSYTFYKTIMPYKWPNYFNSLSTETGVDEIQGSVLSTSLVICILYLKKDDNRFL